MRKISFVFAILLIVFASNIVVAQDAKSKDERKAAENHLRALYKDKVRFEMLSGAAQNSLERKFGRKTKITVDAPVAGKPRGTGLSPSAVIPNVLVNDPTADLTAQDTQSETTITLAGPNIVAGFNDSGSYNGSNTHFTGYAYSTDGGATWTDPGQLPNNAEGDAGDPVLARNNTTGRIYFTTLGFNTGEVLQSFRSDDNGVTFMAPVSFGSTGAGDFQDKQWITVDNFVGTGQGNAYVAWRSFGDGIYFTRSTDNGTTFSAAIQVAAEGAFNVQGAFVAVAPNHAVHVWWLDQSAGSGTVNIIKTRKSTDGGLTFSAPVNVRTLMTTATNGNLGLNGGFRTNAFPHFVINPVSSNIYGVFNDDVAGADKSDNFLTTSTDGGATWATINVSDIFDSSTNDDYSPTLAVTPDGSKLLVVWYDRQLDPSNLLIDYFGAIADVTSGITFGPQFRITSESFPPVIGQDPVINPVYMGDYDQAVADNSNFHITWGDNRDGNSFHTNQPDVRYGRIPVAGPGAILAVGSITTDDSGGNSNGDIDFNECIGMNVPLSNGGTATATGVTATLSTTTAGVTITNATSSYPDIAIGGSQTNSVPFRFQTSALFVCGTPIDFRLDVNTTSAGPAGGASYSFTFTLQTGTAGSPTQFDNNTPVPIPDLATTNIPILVSGFSSPIQKATLSVYATHTFDGDLAISLIAPDATEVALSLNNGGSGDNYGTSCSPESSRTTFDDAAATSINAGIAPFAGTFRPEGSLADFIGKSGGSVNGTWTLKIVDQASQDSGNFFCASLFLSPATCTDGGPCTACSYFDLFDDDVLTWLEEKADVTETGGFLVLTPVGKKAVATSDPVFAGCQNCTITSEIQFTGGDVGSKAWMLTHRIDKNNQIEILLKLAQGRVVVKQRAGAILKKVKGSITLLPNTLYTVEANYDGTDYEVRINGTLVVILVPVGTIPSGVLGFQSKLQTTSVNRVCVTP